jgi:hypothetical protein
MGEPLISLRSAARPPSSGSSTPRPVRPRRGGAPSALRHAAGPPAKGADARRHHHRRGGQPVPQGGLPAQHNARFAARPSIPRGHSSPMPSASIATSCASRRARGRQRQCRVLPLPRPADPARADGAASAIGLSVRSTRPGRQVRQPGGRAGRPRARRRDPADRRALRLGARLPGRERQRQRGRGAARAGAALCRNRAGPHGALRRVRQRGAAVLHDAPAGGIVDAHAARQRGDDIRLMASLETMGYSAPPAG